MVRAILLCLLFSFVVPVFVLPERAAAADAKILDAAIDRYMDAAEQWEPRIKQAARKMFWLLATVSMVFTFAFMFARGNVGLGDFFGEFLRFVVTVGFFYWLLDNGSAIARSVIQSFGQLGLEASSTYQADLSPSNLISFALELIGRACSTFGEQDYATSIVALLLSIAVAVLFAMIAAMMVQLLCTAWVLVYAGTIMLGFGGGRWTQDIAINYFKTVLGLALQTFTFCLLVGIGQQQVERLIADSQQVKNVLVKGYVYDSTVSTTSMTITEGCVLLLFTVILFMLVKSVPNMVAGIVSGSSTGGVSLGGGAGGFIAGGAALASGGAMIAAQMAGAGMALNSAYQQTVENKAQGGGMFTGAQGVGGLAGVMSMGMRSAGDFMTNLASGAGTTMKENLQKTTSGGAVSANIDANRQANAAAYEAAQAEQTGGGDGAGAAPLSGGGDDGMGGISSGNPGGGAVDSPGAAIDASRTETVGSENGSGLSKPGYGSNDRGSSFQKPEHRDTF
ncbi:MAG: P-type conjugative transfer protein TrbL [Planctomycetota bacterium]|jgi:P-type conjugative transfer protein TrbL|nr:P-type conjugative transfer protein TrbL [Planctomycetota bacterium]